jgi:putative transposase
MRRSRFSEEQIIGMLKEHESGVSTADVCRKYGVSSATFYKYRQSLAGWMCLTPASSRHSRTRTRS